ncbi:type II secretion system F family protein [Desulfatitalea alkaliphila]|uniref:Type II secretion system F family protein n=1 Tax=Desulfatitalea alkaliphila TaxID=2929485 RepID=A0AA41R200_9BACT|nr:type II secretion system F family protein [Desulfatitalea alkaliphila]MCJ8499370.1 type II secretion system F family protein [Desulfatitalea alkaliphila]
MALFLYKATDADGKVVSASLESDDEAAAVARIQKMGLIPIRVTPAGKQPRISGWAALDPVKYLNRRITGKDVMLFTQDLASLLGAGLPVDRALSILVGVSEREAMQATVADILKMVQGGAYLSDALAKYPRIFSEFYVNMVRAGEAGGVLEDVLGRLGTHLQSAQDLADFIKSAMVYPIFLVTVSGISIIILMTYVMPKFTVLFADMGATIPWSTKLLLQGSDLLRNFWWLLLAISAAAVFLAERYRRTPRGRRRIDQWKLRLFLVGDLVRKMETARFARTLGTLTRSGVPILQGLDLVRKVLGNQVFARSMEQVRLKVKEGDRLAPSLAQAGLFPSLALQMITVGEETGRLEEMLFRIADNYEKALTMAVKRFTSLIEPVMILAMAIVVGFIVISMLMAIFSMNELPF